MIKLPRVLRPPSAALSPVDREGLRSVCRADRLINRILASSPSGDSHVVALPTHLAVGSGQDWTMISWGRIEKGTWNVDTATISYELAVDGDAARPRRRHRLDEPGDFPRVFRDRVNASIAFQRYLPIEDRRSGITISARRDLSTGHLDWRVTTGKGIRLTDPGVGELAEAALQRFRNEYDI